MYFRNVNEKKEARIDLVAHHLVPLGQIVLISREAIDEKLALVPAICFHGFLKKANGDLCFDNPTVLDIIVDNLSHLRARVPL